ncbi:calcium-binding protein, partial [bacterium]|nr:calcium-binding protein [bacterium]
SPGTFYGANPLAPLTLLYGDGGRDTFGGAFAALIDGGSGKDTWIFTSASLGQAYEDASITLDTTNSYLSVNEVAVPLIVRNIEVFKVYSGAGNDVIVTGVEDDFVSSGSGTNVVRTGAGRDRIVSDGADTIYAGEDDDYVSSPVDGTSNKIVFGEGGNDRVDSANADDEIHGGTGNDAIETFGGSDIVFGDEGDDSITAGSGDDRAYGGSGDDAVNGGAGDDIVDGGVGDDALWGNTGNDHIIGGGGNDRLYGENGDDQLVGEAGDDVLHGGTGVNSFDGGPGNDRMISDDGSKNKYVFVAGDGHDTIEFKVDAGTIGQIFIDGVSISGTPSYANNGMWMLSSGAEVFYFEIMKKPGLSDLRIYRLNAPEDSITITNAFSFNSDSSYTSNMGSFGLNFAGYANYNYAPRGASNPLLIGHGRGEDYSDTILKSTLLYGFTDRNGDNLSVKNLAGDHVSVNENPDGTFTLTPEHNFSGRAELTYIVSDGNGGEVAGRLLLFDVAPRPDAPEFTGAISPGLFTYKNEPILVYA